MGERIVSWARGWNATMFAKQGCEGKRLSARIVGASFGPSVFSVGKHSSASCWETDTSSGSVAGSLRFAVHSSFSFFWHGAAAVRKGSTRLRAETCAAHWRIRHAHRSTYGHVYSSTQTAQYSTPRTWKMRSGPKRARVPIQTTDSAGHFRAHTLAS